ncbi:MAG: hypothetical protein KC729_09255, partial [Candidatus Eisenbacteria bacterium]|nr:hypothetical protein [Candidatus Eisenbacteria bacterium]
ARLCWRWAMATIALQIVDGFLLLMALPREVLRAFMRGGAPTMVPLALGILLGVGLLMMLARPIDPIAKRKLITGTLASLVLTIAVMAITRDQVRALYLEPSTESFHPTVVPQWGNFVLFVVLLIAALGTVAYMTKRALAERATGDDAA